LRESTDYIYAVSRVRAIEKGMIDYSMLERILDLKSVDQVMGLLEEIEYGNITENRPDVSDFEYILVDELKKLKILIDEVAADIDFIKTIFHVNDYHNAKVFLKCNSDNEYDDLIIDIGLIEPQKLKTMILEQDLSSLPKNLKESIEMCINNSSILNDPKSVDIILDRAYLNDMYRRSLETNNNYIINLSRTIIDIYNIKSFIRIKNRDKNSWDLINKVILNNGKIDRKIYLLYMEKDLDELVDYFKYTDYRELISIGIEKYNEDKNFNYLEKLSDDYIIKYLKNTKVITFGFEPIVGYIMAKQMEIKNLRIIMTGKINNIPKDILRERLRECYV
jgi:V/A-type H+-transporting ATPase subunit C